MLRWPHIVPCLIPVVIEINGQMETVRIEEGWKCDKCGEFWWDERAHTCPEAE